MSDHCRYCRYDPKNANGEDACPFTTLYWNFLAQHRKRFAANARMRNQYLKLERKAPGRVARHSQPRAQDHGRVFFKPLIE